MTRTPYVVGWIPESFILDISSDRSSANVLRPKDNRFGRVEFKTGLFGSDLWARGRGTSNSHQNHSYTIQLRLQDSDRQAKVVVEQQGYRPLHATFACRPITDTTKSSSETPSAPLASNGDNNVVLLNDNTELFFNHSNTRVKIISNSPYLNRLVNALQQNMSVKVAIIISDSWYRPEKYQFTYYQPASIGATTEGGANVLIVDDFELSRKLRQAHRQGKNIYLSGSASSGDWAWSRFKTK